MKKILVASLFAALGFAASACGDGICETPTPIKLMESIQADVTTTVTPISESPTPEEITKLTTECQQLGQQMKKVADDNNDITKETLADDWKNMKGASGWCWVALLLNGTIKALNFNSTYTKIKEGSTICTTAAGAAIITLPETFESSFNTLEGWNTILHDAAEYTDKKVEEEKKNK